MIALEITRGDLARIKELSDRGFKHDLWIGVFGCNGQGEVWPQNAVGLVPLHRRIAVRGRSPKLDEIVEIFLQERRPRPGKPGGGRFFINGTGAYYTDDREKMTQFLEFRVAKKPLIRDRLAKRAPSD